MKRKEPQGQTRVQPTRGRKERKKATPEVQKSNPATQGGSPSSQAPGESPGQSNAGRGEAKGSGLRGRKLEALRPAEKVSGELHGEPSPTSEQEIQDTPVHQDPGSPGAAEQRGIQALDRPEGSDLVSHGKPASLRKSVQNRPQVVVVPPPLPIPVVMKFECITLSSDEEEEPVSPPTDRQAPQTPRALRIPPGITITRVFSRH